MKIALSPSLGLFPLRRRLELEGNQLVDACIAEFLITDKVFESRLPAMFSGEKYNTVVMKELGYELSNHPADCYVSKWFDQTSGFSKQTFLGVPTIGLANKGTSAAIMTGSCGTWVHSPLLESLFSRPELTAIHAASHHSGFVTLWISSEDGLPSEMETGVPAWGLYNVLEGLPGTLAEFLQSPSETRWLQSYTTSLLLSRYPYPAMLQTKDACQVSGLSANIEKHFWLGDCSHFKNSWWTNSTIVGVATSWSDTLWKSNALAVATCGNITLKEVQYRTDSDEQAELVLERMRRFL